MKVGKRFLKNFKSRYYRLALVLILVLIVVYMIVYAAVVNSAPVYAEKLADFAGNWKVSKYVGGSVPYHEENDVQGNITENDYQEIIEDYLNREIKITTRSLEYFSPATELGYDYESWADLFMIYRVPHDLDIEMTPPFTCANIKTKKMGEEINMIIDSNGTAVLYVRGAFFEMKKE